MGPWNRNDADSAFALPARSPANRPAKPRRVVTLRSLQVRPHPRHVRHATQDDLDHAAALLAELRKFPQLRERKPGNFSRGSRAFLHFHEDAGDLYVDVRLDSAFQRIKVTSPGEQAEFLSQVRIVLQSAS